MNSYIKKKEYYGASSLKGIASHQIIFLTMDRSSIRALIYGEKTEPVEMIPC